jgi:hypothetical protein
MPTIIALDAPLSTAADVNAAIVDENLINFESGHLHKWVYSSAVFASPLLCWWSGSSPRVLFLLHDVVSFWGCVQMGVLL